MSNKQLPFYTQAAILDEYINSSDPESDSTTLQVILELLRTREDLRKYFFQSGPNSFWAEILWKNGFFDNPPQPEIEGEYYHLPRWYEQEFLVTVANEVPDIVIKHVSTIKGHGFYISRAIEALNRIDVVDSEKCLNHVVDWLNDPAIAAQITSEVFKLYKKFAEIGNKHSAFQIFRILTSPLPPPKGEESSKYRLPTYAVSRSRGLDNKILSDGVQLLQTLDIKYLVNVLEEHLLEALHLEAQAREMPGSETSSWWRSAIEDTNQDTIFHYKDHLLISLRDTVQVWTQENLLEVRSLVTRYLFEKHGILRRMAFHLLNRYPEKFVDIVKEQLLNYKNLYDSEIHHEYFLLLQNGFSFLSAHEKKELTNTICNGPSDDYVTNLTQWAVDNHGADPNDYSMALRKHWIRDRLIMLKSYLRGEKLKIFESLITETGTSEHPEFTRWSSGAYWVRDVSPITGDELSKLTIQEFLHFLTEWQPDPKKQFGPERISFDGLSKIIANIVFSDLDKYKDFLVSIALLKSSFASALIEEFAKPANQSEYVWGLFVNLCEHLLANELISKDTDGDISGQWIWARNRIVSLISDGLGQEGSIPNILLDRIKMILISLTQDPDYCNKDHGTKGWQGYDPATESINHVRPLAISALIDYALYVVPAESKEGGPGTQRLDPEIREVLTKILEFRSECSSAVLSVFGNKLWTLYWLDEKWVHSHIDEIFPTDNDESSIQLFVAAWDSFVMFNNFNTNLICILYPKYEKAIYNLSRGFLSETHLRPEESLSAHLIWEYFLHERNSNVPDGSSLLETFFEVALPEQRGTACWMLWRFYKDMPSDMKVYWPKVRKFWESRIQKASEANNSTDFDKEFEWLAHLPIEVKSYETIKSLWPLLEGLLPHINRGLYGSGWFAIQEFLAYEVDRDPERSIQFYYLMYAYSDKRSLNYQEDETRKIIETAASCKASRKKALDLIDLLARKGVNQYRDIYEKYSGI